MTISLIQIQSQWKDVYDDHDSTLAMTESNNNDKQAQSASYFALSVRRYTENRTKEECSRTVPETEALLMLCIAMAASA